MTNERAATNQSPKRVAVLLVVVGLMIGGGAALYFTISAYRKVETSSPPSSTAAVEIIPKPARPNDDYIGSEACAECHSQIAERYARSAMGRSMKNVADEVLSPKSEQLTTFQKGAWNEWHCRSVDRADVPLGQNENS